MNRFRRQENPNLLGWRPGGEEVKVPHKLTDQDIREIRLECQRGGSYGNIGRAFGVVGTTIARIARGELRKAVGGPVEGKDYPAPERAAFGRRTQSKP